METHPKNQQSEITCDPFVQFFYDQIIIAGREPHKFIEYLSGFGQEKESGVFERYISFLDERHEAKKRQEALRAKNSKLEAELSALLCAAIEFCNEHQLEFHAECCFSGLYTREWLSDAQANPHMPTRWCQDKA